MKLASSVAPSFRRFLSRRGESETERSGAERSGAAKWGKGCPARVASSADKVGPSIFRVVKLVS